MFPRAHFHGGVFRHTGKRDIFVEYGSVGALDHVSTFGNLQDLGRAEGVISQQSRVRTPHQTSWSAAVPCLPLLPPVFGEEDKTDCCAGETKQLRRDYIFLSWSNRFIKKEGRIRAAKVLLEHLKTGNLYYPTALLRQWMKKSVETVGNKLRKEPYCPAVNSSFTGGCLSSFTWPRTDNNGAREMQYLCYSGGVCQEEIAVTALENVTDNGTVQTGLPTLMPVSSRIKQICSSRIADQAFIGVRCDADTHILCGKRNDNQGVQISEIHHKRWKKVHPTSVALSEFIPGEALIAGNNGDCYILDHTGRLIRAVKKHEPAFHSVEPWHHAQYGSHPRQLLLTESTSVALYDIRGRSVKEVVFAFPHELFHQLERVTVASPYRNNSSYYVFATQTSVVLADIRFPHHAVLHWSHSLPAAPAYMDVVNGVTSDLSARGFHQALSGSVEDVLLLGTQEENEVQAFPLSLSQPPPVKTSLPWVLSRPRDILGFGLVSELAEPLMMERRLDSSFCGLTGLKNTSGDGFTAYTITAMGDIFYQTFSLGSSSKDKSWRHGPGSHNLKVPDWAKEICTEWTNKCQQHKDEQVLAAVETEAQADLKEKSVLKQRGNPVLYLDSSGISARKELAHVLCWLCMRQLQDGEAENPSESDQTCCACGMSIRDGHYLSEVVLKDNVMQKFKTEKSSLEGQLGRKNLEIPEDPYSQILSRLWEEDEPDLTELAQEREDLIRKAVENKQHKERNESDEDLSDIELSHLENLDKVQESVTIEHNEDTEEAERQEPLVQETESASQGKQNTEQSEDTADQVPCIPATPSRELLSPPDGLSTPRRKRRLSTSSSVSMSSIKSTGSAAQGFLVTPKRLLQRSRHASPRPSASPNPYTGILSPISTPIPDSCHILPSLVPGFSQPSASRPMKRKATPSSASKKKHRMGF